MKLAFSTLRTSGSINSNSDWELAPLLYIQATKITKIAIDANATASMGPVDDPTVSFEATTKYEYPCTTKFTASA